MIPEIKYTDFPNICRLCMHSNIYINIFDRPDLINVIKIIGITVKNNDNYPENVCQECVSKLEILRDFIQICKTAHDYLTGVILPEDDKKILFQNTAEEADDMFIEDASELHDTTEDEESEPLLITNNVPKLEKTGSDNDEKKSNISESITLKIDCDTNNIVDQIKTNDKKCNSHFKNTKSDICKSEFNPGVESIKILPDNEEFKKTLRKQIEMRKGKEKWKCFECNKEFTKKIDLQRHLRIHTGSKPFLCLICDLKFTQKSSLSRHIKAVHTKNIKEKYTLECYICAKKFNRKDHLEAHMINIHIKKIDEHSFSNPEVKACEDCGKTFSLLSYMKHHLLSHLYKEEQKIRKSRSEATSSTHLCYVCGKSFEKRPTYLQHMRRTHPPAVVKKTRRMKTEKKKQNGSKNPRYQCWYCGKIKTTLCNFKVHIRMHTGEKPYECKFCYRKFTAWNSWHDHENIHLGLKPYQCDHCKKVFRQRSSLRKHLRSSLHVHQIQIKNETV